jgi:glucose/mannose-6-phosphate isomerase
MHWIGQGNVLSPKEVKASDREGLWKAYAKWPASIRRSLKQPPNLPQVRKVTSVVLGGMGGSGSACDILADWVRPRVKVPVVVVKDYHLPTFAGRETLVMVVSLSGETKETISLLRESLARGCPSVGFSSGGMLEKLCREGGVPYNRVDRLLVPRASIPGMVLLPARVLVGLGLVEEPVEFQRVVSSVERTLSRSAPSVPYERNISKKLAKSLLGKNVVIYSASDVFSLAHHFKASMNENAKVQVQAEEYPELLHNEVETWVAGRNRTMVMLRRKGDEEKMEGKFERLKEILRKNKVGIEQFVVDVNDLGSFLSLALALDLTSAYLAVLEGKAPAPTPVLTQMRKL